MNNPTKLPLQHPLDISSDPNTSMLIWCYKWSADITAFFRRLLLGRIVKK